MKSERPLQIKAGAWIPAIVAVIALFLLGFSVRSLVLLFAEPRPADVFKPEAAAEMQNEDAVSGKPGTEIGAPETRLETAAQDRPRQPATELGKDFQALRERESVRQATVATLREIATENPESGYAMTEEQIRKLEQSGASFQ